MQIYTFFAYFPTIYVKIDFSMGLFGDIVKTILIENILLTEGDDRLKKVNKIMDAEFSGILDLDSVVRGPEYYINDREGNPNPNTTWRQYLLFSLRHTFGLMSNSDVKYLPFVAKLAFSNEVGFEKRNNNGSEIAALKKIVLLLKKDDELFEKIKTKPDITFNELYEYLKPKIEAIETADSQAANNVEERGDYDIIWVKDYATAKKYGDESCSKSKLCYTQSLSTWEQYTNNYANKVYVCLKHGWEDIPEVAGPENPYDEYGTSMIFVFIDPNGNISTSNCRWNHHTRGEYNGSVDHAFTKATLAETVGVKFDDVFKPLTKEEKYKLQEEAEMEWEEKWDAYEQQRWEDGYSLWDGCALLVGFDDSLVYNEGDNNYYIYDIDITDDDPASYTEVSKDPVYLNEGGKMAVLKMNYGGKYVVVANCDAQDRYERRSELKVFDDVTYYKIFQLSDIEDGNVLICFNRVGNNNMEFGFVTEGRCGFAQEGFNFGLSYDEDEGVKNSMFINEEISDYLYLSGNKNAIPIEVVHYDGKHSLFIIEPDNGKVITVVKKDFPKGDMFEYDPENGCVIGTLSNYSLTGEALSDYGNESGGRIISIGEHLFDDYYYVEVESADNRNNTNLIKRGENKKLIPFDFAKSRCFSELGLFVPKKFNGGNQLDYECYLFDLNTRKIVSKPHNDFLWQNGVLAGGDCKSGDVKNGADFYLLNLSDYTEEEGPFPYVATLGNGKAKIKDDNGQVYIFDSNQFRFVMKVADCSEMHYKKEDVDMHIIVVDSIVDGKRYLYDATTMQPIDGRPVSPTNTRIERGYLLLHYADNDAYNMYDLDYTPPKKVFPNDVTDFDHEYGSMFATAKNGKFMYIFDFMRGRIHPTQYGVDLSAAINPWFARSGGRFLFYVQGNDGQNYRVCYDTSASNEDREILFGIADNEYIVRTDYLPISQAPQDVQLKANAVLYPQQKVQVMNNFNEMLDRMNNIKLIK